GGALFLAMNRNKRGMTLDPAGAQGREIVKKLVATADVVVANLPPAVLRSLALDLDSLRAVKPDIILTTVTGFGAGGPLSHKHGFDGIGQPMFRRWCRMVGAEGWLDDPRFADDQARADHGEIVSARMGDWCAGRRCAEALAELEKASIVAGQVYSPQQALDDEHIRAAHLL